MAVSDFDNVLTTLGMGKWNILYYFTLAISGFMMPGFLLSGSFIAPNMNFNCSTENVEEIVIEQTECTYVMIANETFDGEIEEEIKCSEWTFNDTDFSNTLTSEFQLVCDEAYLRPTFQIVYNIGNFIGAPLNGFLADRFGRKAMMTVASVLAVLSVLGSSTARSFRAVLATRFLIGLTSFPVLQSGYILCMEVCEPKLRSSVGIILSLPWAFGTMWWGVLGYCIRDWRWLMRATTAPAIIYYICLYFIDESPRYLIVNGHHQEALKALQKAARWNDSSLPPEDELLEQMADIQWQSSKRRSTTQERRKGVANIMDKVKGGFNQVFILFRTPELRKRVLLLYTVFLVCAFVFYGLSLNAINFQVDPYMYMVIGGLTEVPAYILPVPIIAKFGRVLPTSAAYFICGVTIMALAFIPPDPAWVVITLAMVGKFCISAAFQIVYLQATELLPTEVRMQGIGTSSIASTIGSVGAPYITDLVGDVYPWVPSVLFGVVSLLAGFVGLFIPETLNKSLPDTVQKLDKEARRRDSRIKCEERETLEIGKM